MFDVKVKKRTSVAVQGLRLHQEAWVWSLVRELRPHMPHGKKKKKKLATLGELKSQAGWMLVSDEESWRSVPEAMLRHLDFPINALWFSDENSLRSSKLVRASQVTLVVKNVWDTRATVLTPGWERSPGIGNGTPLQYSCLENPMGIGALWSTAHRATKSWTQLSN